MSSIQTIDPLSEYGRTRQEESKAEVESFEASLIEEAKVPFVQAASQQQDTKTTIQSFQYTGKGSFIDKVF